MTDTKPISSTPSGTGCLILLFSVFAIAGSAIFTLTFLPAAYHIIQARSWKPTPCRIISSKLVIHSGKSSTYSVAASYSYTFAGAPYQSNRYQFLTHGSSRSRSDKQAIVNHLRPGSTTTCYVNPNHPAEAVIDRSWTTDMWSIMCFSLLFMGVGFVPPVFILKNRARTKLAIPIEPEMSRGEINLKPRFGPFAELLGFIAVALFWNGIVSVFLYEFLQSWHTNQREYFLGLFLIPFVCVGVALVIGIIYKCLALFNPRPHLRLASDSLTPGATTELRWNITGRYDRIATLRMTLEGREEATYKNGKNVQTATNVFASSLIFESTRPQEIAQGRFKLSIPPGAMHTFTAAHNKIIWKIQLKAEIAGWPDIKEDFPLTVRPARPS